MVRPAVLILALLTIAPSAVAVLTPKLFAEDRQEGILADVRVHTAIDASMRPFSPLEGSCTYDLRGAAGVEGGYQFGDFPGFRYEWWTEDAFGESGGWFFASATRVWEAHVPIGEVREQTYSAGGAMIAGDTIGEEVRATAIVRLACPLARPIG